MNKCKRSQKYIIHFSRRVLRQNNPIEMQDDLLGTKA